MLKIFLLFCLCVLLVSCESLSFYSQAVGGQLSILHRRESIQALASDPATDPVLKAKFNSIMAIREFAGASLGLPVEKNFSTYVDLQRPYVVWNVFATPEFSMTPLSWCYPVAGCVSYRGYFSEDGAEQFANKVAHEGHDVYVGGVVAYSTLGWFSDSVLNTIINRDEYRLAELIFHELAHQVVYVPGDTAFNESFATAVELEGLRRWLQANEEEGRAAELVERTAWEKARQREFANLVESYVPRLETLYASDLAPAVMRMRKQTLFDNLRQEYGELKAGWDGFDAYDNWFATAINNAKINTVSTYFSRVSAFEALLAELDYDLPAMFVRVDEISRLTREERDAVLTGLVP